MLVDGLKKVGAGAVVGVLGGEVGRRIVGQESQRKPGDAHLEETDEKTAFKGRVDISSPLLERDKAIRDALSALMEGTLIVAKIISTQADPEAARKMIAIMAKKNIEGVQEMMDTPLKNPPAPAVAKRLAKFIESA